MKYLIIAGLFMNMQSMQTKVNVPTVVDVGLYKHYRTGNVYEVIGIARYSEDPLQELVLYKQLYDSTLQPQGTPLPAGTIWARPLAMFVELVDDESGDKVPRFKKINVT